MTDLPDYPPVILPDEQVYRRPFLIHTRRQAEAGKIHVDGMRLPIEGKVNERDDDHSAA